MEVLRSTETSTDFLRTKRRSSPGDIINQV
jgi:hypothetical protein